MHERADRLASTFVTVDEDLAREFEARLVESSTLAFRVAFGVLRHREDAEDVAQDAFAKAHRSFRQLRDRERFRAWLGGVTSMRRREAASRSRRVSAPSTCGLRSMRSLRSCASWWCSPGSKGTT